MHQLIFLLCFFAFFVEAKVPVDGVVSVCKTYPEIRDHTSFPEQFNSTNNLTHPADNNFYNAEGEKITIYGRILDGDCVPVSDAKIYIWQANRVGYVQYPIKTPNKRHHHQQWVDPNFTGTGITNTDNMGRFTFTTIKPGSFTKVTPHIHIRVEHKDFKALDSKFYFIKPNITKIIDTTKDNNVFIISNKEIISQVSAVAGDEAGVYMIDITLDGKQQDKKF